MEQKPNELLVDKACALWVEMLSNPKFDALGNNPESRRVDDPNGAMAMAQCMAAGLAAKVPATPEQLAKFAETLKKFLMNKVRWNGGDVVFDENGHYFGCHGLHVDYHPEAILAQSAKEAGISERLFPWKTSMWFRHDCISLSYGYGAECVHYYPLDGKWLVTTLSGSDIEKVFDYVRGGKPEFTIQN